MCLAVLCKSLLFKKYRFDQYVNSPQLISEMVSA